MSRALLSFIAAGTAAASVALSLGGLTATDLALGRIAPASAQTAPAGGGQGNQRFAHMLMSLNLSDGEKARIRKIIADARAKAQTEDDRDAKRATMRAAFEQIKTVLTPAQQAKMAGEQAQYRAQHAADTNHS